MKKILFLAGFNYIFFFVSAQPEPTSNVGIGIANPTRAKLEVHGAVGATSAIFGGESSGISLQRFWPGIGFNQYWFNQGKYMSNGFAAMHYFDPTTGNMFIDMFGSGIKDANTTAPVRALTIANNGNIGIKTNPGNASLYVRKGTNFDGAAVIGGSTYNSHFNYSSVEDTYIRGGITGSNVYINDIPGGIVSIGGGTTKVGINTYGYSPSYTLEVKQFNNTGLLLIQENFLHNWELRVVNAEVSGASANLSLWYYNDIKGFFRTNGEYADVSDRRLKTNIQPLPSLLDKVMQLKPVLYEMKDHNPNKEKSLGFLAQDVKTLFPQLVSTINDPSFSEKGITDLHAISYSLFGVLAIKAIQEQQHLLNDMEKRMQLLEEQNKMLLQLIKNKN